MGCQEFSAQVQTKVRTSLFVNEKLPRIVIPSEARNLRPQGGRPFAEFTLSEANVLRVT